MAIGETPNLSLSASLFAEVEKAARAQERTVNEVLEEALNRYLKEPRWADLKSYGRERARERGISEVDVPVLIAESRQEYGR